MLLILECSRKTATELIKCGEQIYNNPEFSIKTLNTSLHSHLELKHILLYLAKLKEEGWQVQLPLLKAAFSSGYSFKTLIAVFTDSNVAIDNLPPPPPLGDVDYIPSNLGPQSHANLDVDLPEFSIKALHDFLVGFVVTDNQVRLITCQLIYIVLTSYPGNSDR